MYSTFGRFLSSRLQHPTTPGIKINLYRDYEYRAVAAAIARHGIANIESVMVGDSFFMTHMARSSTRLSAEDSLIAKTMLPKLVNEVRLEIDRNEFNICKPLLMADVPDSLSTSDIISTVNNFIDCGADIIKLEVASDEDLWPLAQVNIGKGVWAIHLGYTSQKNENKVYDDTAGEIAQLKQRLLAAHRYGAAFVVFERVAEIANRILTRTALDLSVVPYSIFSGRAPGGGQSLNVWDSVVRADRESIFFPQLLLSNDKRWPKSIV